MHEDGDNVHWLESRGFPDQGAVGAEMAFIGSLREKFVIPAGFCLDMTAGPRWNDFAGLEAVLGGALARFPGRAAGDGLSLRVRASVGLRRPGPLPRAPSFHNVGEDALVEAVVESAAPFLSARRRGTADAPAWVAVVVQRYVRPRTWISASVDPGAADRLVVLRAGWGLKEDDEVADVLVINGASRAVTVRHVADKRRMTVDAPGGGVREEEVREDLREVPCLDDRTAAEVAGRTWELVGVLKSPVRIELELTGSQLHLLAVPSLNATPQS